MYDGDSFYTLTIAGQIGLVLVSVVFAVLTLGLTRIMMLRRPLIIKIPLWFFLFICFVWASPQGYYMYYRLIFDGLPAQWVIGALPPPQQMISLLTFQHQATLSAHSVGVLGWAMLAVALWPQRRKCRNAAD
mmetsp:Transcript_24008/g.44072  ORF Transcript_24008/g.44072 Transcript_24008/m.44072 type:complete len:132 (+) Transcript_24008:5493-5888(+)